MRKGQYDFNTLSECKEHFTKFNEVTCSGYTVNQFFTYCMAEGIKIQVEKISDTQYYFIYQGRDKLE